MSLLVAPMLRGSRELIAGLLTDPQFGPVVMLGIGGIFAEALGDVACRLLPALDLDEPCDLAHYDAPVSSRNVASRPAAAAISSTKDCMAKA